MATQANPIPEPLFRQLVEEHGKNTALWPEELRDLINPSIQARTMQTPQNGRIIERLNREYEYFWAKDVEGQNPDHSRVMALKFDGWEFATTDDVKMANDFVVKGRNKNVKSKDGGDGFSNEIRNGDLRLMKIPMLKWKEIRKAQNLAAYQTAYPRIDSSLVGPMSNNSIKSNLLDQDRWEAMRGEARVSDAAEELATGEIKGNASVAKIPKS